jgi:hypothetical protein
MEKPVRCSSCRVTIETKAKFIRTLITGNSQVINYFKNIRTLGKVFLSIRKRPAEKFAGNTGKNVKFKKMYPGDRRIPNDQSSITHAGFGLLNGCYFISKFYIKKDRL